nr:ethylene-responsive transcription factor ERF054-like [Aegilops tauschii subsp. strangulata]
MRTLISGSTTGARGCRFAARNSAWGIGTIADSAFQPELHVTYSAVKKCTYTRKSSTFGCCGVLARPSGVYYAEIRSGDTRLGLGTFETAHEAAHAYDATAWHLWRPRAQLNLSDTRAGVGTRPPPPPPPLLITAEDHHIQRRRERHLLIAETDEHAIAAWWERFPEDVATENEFWAQRAADRADRRERKALAVVQCELRSASTFDDNDPCWEDAFLLSDDTIKEDEE